MATIPKERRRGKPQLDMNFMLAMMDRYGPEAQRRRQLEDKEFGLRERHLKQDMELGQARTEQEKQELELRKQQFDFTKEDRPGQRQAQEAQLAALLGQNYRAQGMFPIQQGTAQEGLSQARIATQNQQSLQPFVVPQASTALAQQLEALQQQQVAGGFQAPMLGQQLRGAVTGNAQQEFALGQQQKEAEVRNRYMPGLAENAWRRDAASTQQAETMAPLGVNQAALSNVNMGAEAAYRQALAETATRQGKMAQLQAALAVGADNPVMMQNMDPAVLQELSGGLFRMPPPAPPISQWREEFLNNAQRAPMAAFDMLQKAPPGYKEALALQDEDIVALANNVTPESLLTRQGVMPQQPGLWQKAMEYLSNKYKATQGGQ